jgi:hypothetical protein
MPPRPPLLQSVGAAQNQITTVCSEPPLSLAVPYSMPQRCPNPSRMTPHLQELPSPTPTSKDLVGSNPDTKRRYGRATQELDTSTDDLVGIPRWELWIRVGPLLSLLLIGDRDIQGKDRCSDRSCCASDPPSAAVMVLEDGDCENCQ